MINAKPKPNTLVSIGIFLVIAYGVAIYTFIGMLDASDIGMMSYLLFYTSGPIAVVVTLKTAWGYKTVKISKERFNVKYPFRFKEVKFSGKELERWKVSSIKTLGGVYDEMELITKTGVKISLSRQEHSDYDKAYNYMIKKFKRIKK